MRFARSPQFRDIRDVNLSREFLTEVNFKRAQFVDDLPSSRISGKR
jgi:hypothetical protein